MIYEDISEAHVWDRMSCRHRRLKDLPTTPLLTPGFSKTGFQKSTRRIFGAGHFAISILYFGDVAAPRYALNKNKYLIDPEVERLERVLESDQQAEMRDVLILQLALKTGARAMELLNLRHVDLNPYDHSIFIRGIKGSNDRELPIKKEIFERLIAYANTQDRNADLFPIGYHRLRQIWDWYRPVPKKFHSLRHTFAIRLYRKTKDLRLVQVALGHRNITNTMVYADYVYSQSELKKLIL